MEVKSLNYNKNLLKPESGVWSQEAGWTATKMLMIIMMIRLD